MKFGARFLIWFRALACMLMLAGAFPSWAQEMPMPGTLVGQAPTPATPDQAAVELNYDEWDALANSAETLLENPDATEAQLDPMRAQVVVWRTRLLAAQSTNAGRIATLNDQIAALGPVPPSGEVEPDEILTRRQQLNEQLARLQAPSIAAEVAYRRAEGLVREIDLRLRELQANALLRLLPSPLNPANWPEGYGGAKSAVLVFGQEITARWALPTGPSTVVDHLPAILILTGLGLFLMLRGWMLIEKLIARILRNNQRHGFRVLALILSLAEILVPVIGAAMLSGAAQLTGLFGIVGTQLIEALPLLAMMGFSVHWLGLRIFPRESAVLPLRLNAALRARGRSIATLYALLLVLEGLRVTAINHEMLSEAARSVLSFPGMVIAGLLLFQLGRLLGQSTQPDAQSGEQTRFSGQFVAIIGRVAMVIAVVAPLLAAIGYVSAASALIWPALASICLIAVLYLLQVLIGDVYALLSSSTTEGESSDALGPVLLGFGLVVASLPLFALVWGARPADLTELWNTLRAGFSIGDTRISPTNFLSFLLFFAVGYMATKLVQGALKSTILPRTRLDKGGRNALIAGIGYLGIFLSALIAINAAGIDLSGLAFVAGGLSLGLGFGLQNIVSNFVSGIILLIERPVSEGDWIEVSGVQGNVKSISVRSTRIQTFDRTDVIVPNTELVVGNVTNYTRFNLSGRLIVPVGVAYGTDSRKVEKILMEIAEAQPLALLNPPPQVLFQGFGQDAMNFEIRVILRDVNFSLAVRSEINHQIVQRFAQEQIEIPFAQTDITIRNAAEVAGLLRAAGPGQGKPGAEQPAASRRSVAAPRTQPQNPPAGKPPEKEV